MFAEEFKVANLAESKQDCPACLGLPIFPSMLKFEVYKELKIQNIYQSTLKSQIFDLGSVFSDFFFKFL